MSKRLATSFNSIMCSKRQSLTLEKKIDLLDKLKALPSGKSQRELADELQVPRATLQKLVANEATLRKEAENLTTNDMQLVKKKRNRTGKDSEVEESLLIWFEKATAKNLPVTGPILSEKAEALARRLGKLDFKATDGWLNRWKVRNNIVFKRAHGEAQSADIIGASSWRASTIPNFLSEYRPEEIYNADDTGLYYRATPDGSLVFRKAALSGSKKAMERLTVLVCANMSGSDRCKLLVIGKAKQPRCMKNLDRGALPVNYDANKTAWMTSELFTRWVHKWDRRLVRTGRSILLLVDNAPCHQMVPGLQAIKLQFLPPNTTALIQPMDQGIIRNLKHLYRKQLLKRLVDAMDANIIQPESSVGDVARTITVLEAIQMLSVAWSGVKETTIRNCFAKSGKSCLQM